jgi:hypothetical protein
MYWRSAWRSCGRSLGTCEERKGRSFGSAFFFKCLTAGPFRVRRSGRLRYGATVIVTGISFVNEPEVPIRSMVVVPVGARREADQVMVAVAVPFAGTVMGLAEAVAETPLGNSFTLSVTDPLNPFTLVRVSVVLTLPRSSMVKDEGDSDMVKFFVPPEAFTVSAIVAL